MIKAITITLFLFSATLFGMAQNTFPASGNVGIGTTGPAAMLHVRTNTGAAPSFPSMTSKGDIHGFLQADNNGMEFGVARGTNTRRAWILARHASNSDNLGRWYSTLHLQPALELMDQYRGVAIGYSASTQIPVQTGLVVNSNVGIGTTDPQAKLAVNGNILAREVKVKNDIAVPDYVFAPDYGLPALADVEAYVKEHRHLPEVPSAKDIEKDGLNLAEMNLLLLKKVEELTLYLMEERRERVALEKRMDAMDQRERYH